MFLPLLGLIAVAAILGWRFGQPVTESEIINRYAAEYVHKIGAGARLEDCYGKPAAARAVRLVVVCRHPSGVVHSYPTGRGGALVGMSEGPEA